MIYVKMSDTDLRAVLLAVEDYCNRFTNPASTRTLLRVWLRRVKGGQDVFANENAIEEPRVYEALERIEHILGQMHSSKLASQEAERLRQKRLRWVTDDGGRKTLELDPGVPDRGGAN